MSKKKQARKVTPKKKTGPELPWHVRTEAGNTFVQGFDSEEDAALDRAVRNARAIKHGYVVRYKVVEKEVEQQEA